MRMIQAPLRQSLDIRPISSSPLFVLKIYPLAVVFAHEDCARCHGHDEGPGSSCREPPLRCGVSRDQHPLLTGDTPQLEAGLKQIGCTDGRVKIVHTTQVVEMHDSGIDAVRKKKDSSVSRAVDLVKEGAAEAIVSAGNTGAAVAAATIKLRTLPGIERPAIAATMPTERGGHFLLCDAGANPIPPGSARRQRHMALAYSAMCWGSKIACWVCSRMGQRSSRGTSSPSPPRADQGLRR